VVVGLIVGAVSGWAISGGNDGSCLVSLGGDCRNHSGELAGGIGATPDRVLAGSLPDWRVAGDDPRLLRRDENIHVAGRMEPVLAGVLEGVSPTVSAPPGEGVDVRQTGGEPARVGLWLISHYFCEGDSTGAYCPWGRATASGIPVSPGVAACEPALLRRSVASGGISFLCADTGEEIGPGVIDILCYSAFCWDEACTEACPAPCEEVLYGPDGIGRCYAMVEVIE